MPQGLRQALIYRRIENIFLQLHVASLSKQLLLDRLLLQAKNKNMINEWLYKDVFIKTKEIPETHRPHEREIQINALFKKDTNAIVAKLLAQGDLSLDEENVFYLGASTTWGIMKAMYWVFSVVIIGTLVVVLGNYISKLFHVL